MDYIQTRSPITQPEMDELIESLAKVSTATIDGVVLSNLVRTCYECGLKTNELIALSVGDVSKGGKINDLMDVGDSKIPLSERAKEILQGHIDYLKIKGYPQYSSKPLFPTKSKKRYSQKNLGNHLKAAQDPKKTSGSIKSEDPKQESAKGHFTLEKIRQAGICDHYDELKSKRVSANDYFEETKIFARTSYGHLRGILTGNILQTGKKSIEGKDIEYLEAIDKIIGCSPEDIEKLQEIKSAVLKEKAFHDNSKDEFVKWIDDKIAHAQTAASEAGQPSDRSETAKPRSLKEHIDGFTNHEVRSKRHVYSAEERALIDELSDSDARSENHEDAAEKMRKFFFGDDDK